MSGNSVDPFKSRPAAKFLMVLGFSLVAVIPLVGAALAGVFEEGIFAGPFTLPLALVAAGFLWRLGRRLGAKSATEARSRDGRPCILYLRSFAFDQEKIERDLAKAISKWSPFLAFGRPGEKLAPLGANRDYLPAGQWRQEVEQALAASRLVVVRVGESPSLVWEVGRALELLPLSKIVFFFPAGLADYSILKDTFGGMLAAALPRDSGSAMFLAFSAAGQPTFLNPSQAPGIHALTPVNRILRKTLQPLFEASPE